MKQKPCVEHSRDTCPEVNTCSTRLKVWSLITSLILSLVKGIVGILGKSEALVADGLYSFYQSYICARSIITQPGLRLGFAGVVIGLILALGVFDVFIFSIVELIKSAKGLLVEPSPYALCAAVVSIIANHLLSHYSICIKQQPQIKSVKSVAEETTELHRSFRLSTIISIIALIGIALSRWGWLGGDALATIIIVGLLIKPVAGLFRKATEPLRLNPVKGGSPQTQN